jgi:hypothetical protein
VLLGPKIVGLLIFLHNVAVLREPAVERVRLCHAERLHLELCEPLDTFKEHLLETSFAIMVLKVWEPQNVAVQVGDNGCRICFWSEAGTFRRPPSSVVSEALLPCWLSLTCVDCLARVDCCPALRILPGACHKSISAGARHC